MSTDQQVDAVVPSGTAARRKSNTPNRVGLDREEVTEDFENPIEYKMGQQGHRFYSKPAGRKETFVLDRMWRQTILFGGFEGTPCLLWTGALRGGYGSVWYHGRYVRIHRMAMILDGHVLTRGMQIDHLCENKSCWNTLHLEEVTARENKMREIARRRKQVI